MSGVSVAKIHCLALHTDIQQQEQSIGATNTHFLATFVQNAVEVQIPAILGNGYHRSVLIASGRLKSSSRIFLWVSEAPVELGFGSAGASLTRQEQNCRSLNRELREN